MSCSNLGARAAFVYSLLESLAQMSLIDPFLPVTNGSYGVPQLRFAQSLYDCGVGAQVSHLTPPTHALAEGSSDTCSPKDNRPDLNLQRVLTI